MAAREHTGRTADSPNGDALSHPDVSPKDRDIEVSSSLPIVSIGMPVYNGERYMERAVQSILDQDFESLELIIVDNASNDETGAIAERLAKSDRRVRYYRNMRNIGAAQNFCRAFEFAKGKYFKWAAYDDWLEPTFVSACVEVLEREPRTELVFSSTNVYDESGRLLRKFRYPPGLISDKPTKRFFNSLWNFKYATAVFGLMRTDTLLRTSLIQSYSGSDRILFSEVALLGRIHELDEYLFNSTETVSVRRGRNGSWWRADPASRPTFDYWHLFGDFIRLVVRTPSLNFYQRLPMVAAVFGFFCRRWPRRALYRELRRWARHTWILVTRGPWRRAHASE